MSNGLKWMLKIVAGIGVTLALLVFVVGREKTLEIFFGPMEITPVNFATLRPATTPNRFLVCPADYCAAQADLLSPIFAGTPADLKRRWMIMLKNQPRIEAGDADDGGLQYDFIQRTKFVGYPDSITVRFIPAKDGRATLAIYSRSHYGQSDFGVNEARVRAWLANLVATR